MDFENKCWHNTVCLDFDGVIGEFPHPNPQIPIDERNGRHT